MLYSTILIDLIYSITTNINNMVNNCFSKRVITILNRLNNVSVVCILPSEIQLSRGEGYDPINGLTPPNVCACLEQGPEFPMSYALVCFLLSEFILDER